MKFVQVSRDLAERHYAVHKGKPFYAGLIEIHYFQPGGGDGLGEGKRVIELVRRMVGSTIPIDADPARSAPISPSILAAI